MSRMKLNSKTSNSVSFCFNLIDGSPVCGTPRPSIRVVRANITSHSVPGYDPVTSSDSSCNCVPFHSHKDVREKQPEGYFGSRRGGWMKSPSCTLLFVSHGMMSNEDDDDPPEIHYVESKQTQRTGSGSNEFAIERERERAFLRDPHPGWMTRKRTLHPTYPNKQANIQIHNTLWAAML